MKVLWMSVAPWAPTGYGMQTGLATPRIKAAGYDVAISATNGLQYTEIEWEGMRVFPADRTNLNKLMLRDHVSRFSGGNPDDVQVISLFDIWPWVDPSYGGMRAQFKGLRMAAWLPVDSYPVPPKTLASLLEYDVRPIAMSRFGEEALREVGQDPLYVPHAIETDVFKPHDKSEARKLLGLPEDAFVIGMVAHNEGIAPPRKSFSQVLQAFAYWCKDHDDAILYLHTDVMGMFGGINLLERAEMFGIPANQIAYTDPISYHRGNASKEWMARLYSSFDVLASPSMGEGFGIPVVEAQACGTPVIVSPFTAMRELAGPAQWFALGQPVYIESTGSNWWQPNVDEIYGRFGDAWKARGDEDLSGACREFALQYDVDRVFGEYWVPALEALDRPREVPPLPFAPRNREQRRSAAKQQKAAA